MTLDDVHYDTGYYDNAEEHGKDDDEEDPKRGDVCATLEVDMGEEAWIVSVVELLG